MLIAYKDYKHDENASSKLILLSNYNGSILACGSKSFNNNTLFSYKL